MSDTMTSGWAASAAETASKPFRAVVHVVTGIDQQCPQSLAESGIVVCQAIPRFSGTPVILMSGEQSGPGIQSSEFLHKPFDPPILLDKVAHLARPHDRRRESERPEHAPIRRQPVAQDLGGAGKAHSRLHSGGKDAALATQVYEVLASSVSILMRFQQATA